MSDPLDTQTRFDPPRAFPTDAASACDPVEHALARNALWEALALGFRWPTAETVERLASQRGAGALADAAAALGSPDGGGLVVCVRALGEGPASDLAELHATYQRLFGHTARGPVPPYETEYGDDSPFLPPREMSDLTAFYRALGLVLDRQAHERPDHIACQCEFMLVVSRKEAYALEIGDGALLEATRRAGRLFLRDHLGRWAPGFGLKLAREAAGGFYERLGRLTTAFVAAECGRAGVPAGPELLRLRSTEPADAPMACGSPVSVERE